MPPPRCCVPLCTTNGRTSSYVPLFYFPLNLRLRSKWFKSIPRENWQPTRNTAVCIKHFASSDISLKERFLDKNGLIKEWDRNVPTLVPNAVPTIFPKLPVKQRKELLKIDKNIYLPNLPGRYKQALNYAPRVSVNKKGIKEIKQDAIFNMYDLKKNYKKRLINLKKWRVEEFEGCLVFYISNLLKDIPKILCSIKIHKNLGTDIVIEDENIEYGDSKWILPEKCVRFWNHLDYILGEYLTLFTQHKEVMTLDVKTEIESRPAEDVKTEMLEVEYHNLEESTESVTTEVLEVKTEFPDESIETKASNEEIIHHNLKFDPDKFSEKEDLEEESENSKFSKSEDLKERINSKFCNITTESTPTEVKVKTELPEESMETKASNEEITRYNLEFKSEKFSVSVDLPKGDNSNFLESQDLKEGVNSKFRNIFCTANPF